MAPTIILLSQLLIMEARAAKEPEKAVNSNRRAASIGAKKDFKLNEDINAQKLFEGQDKRVRGGYDEAISSLHN